MAMPAKRTQKQISATLSLASDEDLKVYCIPCAREGPSLRLPAFGFCQDCKEDLCQTCFSHHKKPAPSMHHVLIDKGAMPKTMRPLSVSAHVSKSDDLTKPCFKHKKEITEFYCQDHNVLLCRACLTLEHTDRSCQLDYIPDISGHILDSQEFKNALRQIDAIINLCQGVKREVRIVTETFNTSVTGVTTETKNGGQETIIYKRTDESENTVDTSIKDDALLQRNNQLLKTTNTICDYVTESVKALSDNIKVSNMSRQANKLFVELKTADVKIKEHYACIRGLERDVKAHQFKFNPIPIVLETETSLGTIEQIILSPAKPVQMRSTRADNHQTLQKTQTNLDTPVQIQVQKPQTLRKTPTQLLSDINKTNEFSYQGEICVKATSDYIKCYITGMTLLNPDQLVLADQGNSSIKMVDIDSKSVSSEITLSSEPWDITSVTSTEIAVTLPSDEEIQFILVASNKLSELHSLKVDGECHGICYFQDKLVVSFEFPAKLEILDMKGTVLTTVTTNANGENIFRCPEYVQVNSDSIYVSDLDTRTVTKLNWQGEITGSYGDLGGCHGLALSADGTVFVCDCINNSITEISRDHRPGKVVIKDVNVPQALCWCDKGHKLYISCGTSNNDIIHVFNKI